MKIALRSASTATVVLTLALACRLRAQSAGEVVTLPEFNVAGDAAGKYVPSESTTGSRVSEKVFDLPFAVDVLTSDFLKDFSVFELNEELSYMTSLTGADDAGNFSLRGFSGNINLRNGYSSLGVMDISSVSRIEILKGSAAAIYGQTNPGGLMVVTTKSPHDQQFESLSTNLGSHNQTQTLGELSGPVPTGGPKPVLFYDLDLQYYRRSYEAPYNQTKYDKASYFDLVYKPDDKTDVRLDANYNLIHNNNTTGLPYLVNPTNTQYQGLAWDLEDKAFASSVDHADRTVMSVDLILEHRFTDNLSLKVGGNYYTSPRWSYGSVGGGGNYDPTTGNLIGRSTTVTNGLILGNGHSESLDLVDHYSIGPTQDITLFTIDSYANERKDPSWSTVAKPVTATMNVNDPVFVSYIPWSWGLVGNTAQPSVWTETRNDSNNVTTTGAMLRQSITWNQLVIGVGARYDYANSDLRNILGAITGTTAANVETKWYTTDETYQVGADYLIFPGLKLYAGRYMSFTPPSTTTTGGVVPPNQTGLTYETGIKGDFLQDRVTFTADWFHIDQKNLSVTELNPLTNLDFTDYLGKYRSVGVEFNGNVLVTRAIQTLSSFSYTDGRTLYDGTSAEAVGQPNAGQSRIVASEAIRWQATTGLSFLLGVRYASSFHVASPTSGFTVNALGVVTADNGQHAVIAPAYCVVDPGANYRWKNKSFEQSLQLFVKNMLDRRYIPTGNGDRLLGDRASVYVAYTVAH